VGVEPERGLDRATSIAGRRARRGSAVSRDEAREACGEEHAQLVEADVGASLDRRLGQLAENHQLRQARNGSDAQQLAIDADRLDELRGQLEREALVAREAVVVAAYVLVAGIPDEDRSCDQLVGLAANATTKAASANVGERIEAMDFGRGDVAGRRRAVVVDHVDRALVEARLLRHGALLGEARRYRPGDGRRRTATDGDGR
jgi:hypothetical protein